jgi:predicted DsbA family dithiol-disulfide isomerase
MFAVALPQSHEIPVNIRAFGAFRGSMTSPSYIEIRLLKAYFVDGRHVGRIGDLADLGAEIGLDRDEIVRVLTSNTYLADVKADVAQAQAYGIQGVPFFVIDGKYGVSGAQDPTAFTNVLEQVRSEKEEVR